MRKDPSSNPRLLFFSGGTALRETARFFARTGTETVHLITPFDSGGSSAVLRRAFAMPAVGDIRNRLMALADPNLNPALFRLLAHRFPKDVDRAELDKLADGSHPLLQEVPEPDRVAVTLRFRQFRDHMPNDFDLQGASLGNLVLTAAYLENERTLPPAIDNFSALVRARGIVRPIVDRDLHLAVRLENGRVVVGQHNITGKETAPLESPIRKIWLTEAVDDPTPAGETVISREVRDLIAEADLICFPMGSFYSSILVNLLPDGVGQAVAANPCPKIFIPDTGHDPEAVGMNAARQASLIQSTLGRDGIRNICKVLSAVMVDSRGGAYEAALNLDEIRALDLDILDHPLADQDGPKLDGEKLGRVLLRLTR